MKKLILAVTLISVLALTACSNQNATQNTNTSPSESLAMLEEGIWPENPYTEGLAVPPGTVSWAVLDTAKGYCSINLIDLTDEEYNAYMELLQEDGFSIVEENSEEVKGQDYITIGTVLANTDKALSISYIPNNLGIYISFIDGSDAQTQSPPA